jgi:uncharacterized protein with GYD domain
MPLFVLMTRLAPESLHDARGRQAAGKAWLRKVKAACPDVRWIAHYALLGPYDFMDIYDAPDVQTAHKVALISRSGGAVTCESWHALPYEEHLDLLEKSQG